MYILVAVDYVSKWVKAQATRANDHKVVVKFVKEYIFYRYGTSRALISDEDSHFFHHLSRLCPDRKDGSLRLHDALWAYRTTYKTPI